MAAEQRGENKQFLMQEVVKLTQHNQLLKNELVKTQEEVHTLKLGSRNIQRAREIEGERGKLLEQMLGQQGNVRATSPNDCAIVQQLMEKDASLKYLLQLESPKQEFVKIPVDEHVWSIYHNLNEGKTAPSFEVMYVHPVPIKCGDSFEVRIDDLGERWEKTQSKFDIGIGVCNMSCKGTNRDEFGFDIGVLSSDLRVMHLEVGDKKETLDCPDSVLIPGDVIRCEIGIEQPGVVKICCRNGKRSATHRKYSYNDKDEYKIFIGLNNRFEKVTLAHNRSFSDLHADSLQKFPKDDLCIYVTSMNEGSPRYAEGVSKGGKHLLRDGMLVRKLCEEGRKIINYQPGFGASTYDAKLGGNFTLEDLLPENLIRNRITLGGNLLTVTRSGFNKYRVVVKSLLSGSEEKFVGTSYEWDQERERLLSSGEKYLINLPTPNGMIQTNDLLIAGTKCKTIHNMIHDTLIHKVKGTEKTAAVLLLGGDRSQTIGSISGALRAYEDICVVYFDAHNDFRDPDASEYPIVHGSPLFFLLQTQLREAIAVWNDSETDKSRYSDETRDAITFINSTRLGRQYWESLKDPTVGYRGFNWLQDSEQINPQRLAFVGVRTTKSEAGSSLGSPLASLFLRLLQLDDCSYPHDMIQREGVHKIFERIIDQFRGTFPDIHERDSKHPDGKWIPPIMVSWDVDSIDPNDLPCTIFQEPDGLTSEECLAFCDEIAATKRLVMMETIEFNPDLWGGYRDEQVVMTINEFESGPYGREPREPADKNKHRMDLQLSTSLLHDMIERIFKPIKS